MVLPQEKFCAQCGAPLGGGSPDGSPEPAAAFVSHPGTIEELKVYCAANGMPLEKMRFFIDQDYRQPRAFGIYRDGDSFVVYKNKDNGSRAVRYQGPDEAYAVNELFRKLLDECHARGIYPDGKPQPTGKQRKAKKRNTRLLIIAVVVMLLLAAGSAYFGMRAHRYDGYYRDPGDAYYYRYGDSWYYDDGYYGWVAVDDFPNGDYDDYYLGDDYGESGAVDDFKASEAWDQIQAESHTSSGDYSSWDSGGTDWSSDW